MTLMQISASIVTISMLMAATWTTIPANSIDYDRTPIPPVAYDLNDNMLEQIIVGRQVILSKVFFNNMNISQPFLGLLEVRDSSGVTDYLAWQTGIMPANGQTKIGVSWMADRAGVYEIRTFPVTNMTNPALINIVEYNHIPAVQDTGS